MAALEFGLVLPVLVMIIFGIVEFGVAFYRESVLAGAVREGARKGIVATLPKATSADIEKKVKDYLRGIGWDPALAGVQVAGAGGPSGSPLTVRATYPTSLSVMRHLIPLPAGLEVDDAGNATLHAQIVMEME